MRAAWTMLIGLCLIVGGVERAPRLELRGDDRLASISNGHAAVPVAVKLRRRPPPVETGLGPATVAARWIPVAPVVRPQVIATRAPAGPVDSTVISSRSARGPPVG